MVCRNGKSLYQRDGIQEIHYRSFSFLSKKWRRTYHSCGCDWWHGSNLQKTSQCWKIQIQDQRVLRHNQPWTHKLVLGFPNQKGQEIKNNIYKPTSIYWIHGRKIQTHQCKTCVHPNRPSHTILNQTVPFNIESNGSHDGSTLLQSHWIDALAYSCIMTWHGICSWSSVAIHAESRSSSLGRDAEGNQLPGVHKRSVAHLWWQQANTPRGLLWCRLGKSGSSPLNIKLMNVKSATHPIDKHAHCAPPQVQHMWNRTHGANNSIPKVLGH